MKLFARAKAEQVAERRSAPRTRVNCPATMVMPSGNRQGRLFDISINGARFITDDPPAQGVGVILDWTTHEAYAQITWTRPGMCGVQFDRPLPVRVVEDLAENAHARPRPVKSAPATSPATNTQRPPSPPTRFAG
ncbi:MAG: PilZ domain-containing protein [Alteraurantiacibacter sp.]